MMRTLWINARFLDRPVTGVERVARELIGALARDRIDASGILRTDAGAWRVQLIAPTSGRTASPWPNIPLVRAGIGTGHLWEQGSLPLLTSGDWLFNPCNTGPALKRRQLVYLHDALPFAMPENFSWRFRTWYRLLFRVISRRAAAVLVNSRFTRAELGRYLGLAPERARLCLLGSDHAVAGRPAHRVPPVQGLPPRGFVLAVSSTNPNKNFAAVIEALRQLGEAAPPCVFVGMQNSRVFGNAPLPAERVTTLGYVDDATLRALYRRALVLVYPSFYEGFGLPPLEAMSEGCPVIVSNTAAMPEVAADAALYCDPYRADSIASAIRRLQEEPALVARLSDRGRHRAKLFSWAASAGALCRALDACAGQRIPHTQSTENARCA